MNKNTWIAVVVVVVILALGGFYLSSKSNQNQQATNPNPVTQVASSPSSSPQESSDDAKMKKAGEIMEAAMKSKDSKKALLTDVSGGTGSGDAFNLRKDGKLLHTAIAKLTDPPTGSFYEGWVVNKATNKFKDSGKLEKQKDGSYEVSKEFDEAYEGYDFIIITQELVDDQKPEKHILEGTAK